MLRSVRKSIRNSDALNVTREDIKAIIVKNTNRVQEVLAVKKLNSGNQKLLRIIGPRKLDNGMLIMTDFIIKYTRVLEQK